jgi:hypothetical protein
MSDNNDRTDKLLTCLDRVGAQLRWLAADTSLPREVRYTLWSLSLDCDSTAASEADTVELPNQEPLPF